MVATEGNEMRLAGFVKTLQSARHKRIVIFPLKPTEGLNGAPTFLRHKMSSGGLVMLFGFRWLAGQWYRNVFMDD
jgi:hypothetical protein